MAQISVEVNGRPYAVGCEDGQEAHLLDLARLFDHPAAWITRGILTDPANPSGTMSRAFA